MEIFDKKERESNGNICRKCNKKLVWEDAKNFLKNE
jgi:hypothetical protein